jgi:hypothetical protein
MGQTNLFGKDESIKIDDKYSSKIKAPIYEPKNKKPHILTLVDTLKANSLIREIEESKVTQEEKRFLIEAAKRHNVFNYSLIADYYAHATEEMQCLMEKSALVIIDFNKAIENGYIKLSQDIAEQYIEDNKDDE